MRKMPVNIRHHFRWILPVTALICALLINFAVDAKYQGIYRYAGQSSYADLERIGYTTEYGGVVAYSDVYPITMQWLDQSARSEHIQDEFIAVIEPIETAYAQNVLVYLDSEEQCHRLFPDEAYPEITDILSIRRSYTKVMARIRKICYQGKELDFKVGDIIWVKDKFAVLDQRVPALLNGKDFRPIWCELVEKETPVHPPFRQGECYLYYGGLAKDYPEIYGDHLYSGFSYCLTDLSWNVWNDPELQNEETLLTWANERYGLDKYLK